MRRGSRRGSPSRAGRLRRTLFLWPLLWPLGTATAAPQLLPPAPLKIGVAGPMSGSDAAFGAELRAGAEQAAHDINAAGGILGRPIVIESADDAGEPKQGIAVADKFVGQHLGFVIGHFNSGVTLAASAIYAENNILMITPASTYPQITERGFDMVFRTCGRDDRQPEVAAAYLASLGPKKIALVHDMTSYGKGFADEMRHALAARGIADVLYEGIHTDDTDFTALLGKLKSVGAEFVFFGGGAGEAGRIVKAMREAGLTTVLIATDRVASDDFAATGGDAVQGSLMTFPRDARLRPEAAKAVKAFLGRNIAPEGYTLYAYAAVELIGAAAAKAKSLAPPDIAKTLHAGMHFSTVLGDVGFDAKGDRIEPDYGIFVWTKRADGSFGYEPLMP